MKKLIILLGMLFFALIINAQNDFNDVIYPVSESDSITDCHIIKIKGWNTIIFEKEDFQDTVLAIAAIKNGRFIDFRTRKEIKDNAYPFIFSNTNDRELPKSEGYFQIQYEKAVSQRKGGARFSLLGAFMGITSYAIMYRNYQNNQATNFIIPAAFLGGGILFNLGTPLWISGGIKARKSEEAMINHQQKDMSINLGVTNNGVGIVFSF